MSVYLSLGKDEQQHFHHIDTQTSGKGALICPFCSCPLIAVKGKQKAPHFRHDGETCQESLNEIPAIPAWHHFHLNIPLDAIEALKKGYQRDGKSPNVFQHWKSNLQNCSPSVKRELLLRDEWTDNWVFTDTARVILGSLTLQSFSQWMRNSLQTRISTLQTDIANNIKHPAWLAIEAHRQQSILSSTLYLFEYRFDDDTVMHKVGRTSRTPEIRLQETVADLQKATNKQVLSSNVLRAIPNAGHVEQYVFHRYNAQLATLGTHTEYLVLDDKAARRLKAEFTKLANNLDPFNKAERFIVTGRWRYEEKRLAAAKRGIELTQSANGRFGRPKGTVLSHDALLTKHADIVSCLEEGKSINHTAQLTGKSRSTVKRVKAVMRETSSADHQ